MNMVTLSIVLPVYNKDDDVTKTLLTISNLLSKAGIEYELVFVSDKALGDIFSLLMQGRERNPRVKIVEYSCELEREAAIFAGLEAATGEVAAVMDCDFIQHPPEMLMPMYKSLQDGFQVVKGVKILRGHESFVQRLFGGVSSNLLTKKHKKDVDSYSDFLILDREVIDALLSMPERNKFFSSEALHTGFRMCDVLYEVYDGEL
jgi:dolichol-phosphate mannosyltransferase